ncbi:centromere-associated protein E [Octopus bimaculoides]|uniref:ODAD1 central coiled coil region domain-containing protein n=1 Tax=Octopus bimaculoides TaxID=37653 RepID=A0A0L8H4V2_OCTBM|nr:centromere-associated protein E [Octopus bimaculoides]|eukprot:XP_014775524.1 PREDICTED: uncharacterized protein LOC106872881 [Octopus bimaculoides]
MADNSKKPHEMGYLQHKLTHLFRNSSIQLNQRNRTLFWQNSNMKRLKLDEAELNFMLYLRQNYKLPHSEQFLKDNMVDVQKRERKLSREVSKPEDLALFDSFINKQKNKIISEQRELNNFEEIEEALKKQIHIMENSLEVKTLEFGQIRSELAKIRNEFYSLNQRLKIFEDTFYKLEEKHGYFFSKMQTISKACVDITDKITEADKKVVGMRQLIKLNECHFNFELNEIDRQSMQQYNFENFMADISRERYWYTLDNSLKKLEKELNTRYRQLREDQTAIAAIKETSIHDNIDLIIKEFCLNEKNNFSLFRFAVEIHGQLKNIDNELQSLLTKFYEEDKSFLIQYSLLRHTLQSYQEKINTELDHAEAALEMVHCAAEQMTVFREDLIELMQVLACDSILRTDVENNDDKDFPRDAIIDVQEKINQIRDIANNVKSTKRRKQPQKIYLYETIHQMTSPPDLATWD